ncbi:MAG: AMP-binding protein [Muribaculaceae bacterium]|nr:AMP-binding protein [Muribaculaceae bacterium]
MTPEEFIEEWSNSKPYITAHTSGSTGTPKEIRLPKRLVAESARRTICYFGLSSHSHLHLPLSADYIAGKMMIVRALLADASITYETPSNTLTGIPTDRVTDLMAVVPSQLDYLLDHKDIILNIRNIIVGGSPVTPALRERCSASACNIVETYGMTETASHVALRNIQDDYFTPLPGIAVCPDADSRVTIDLGDFGIIHTNDIAEFHPDGTFKIIGRADDAIITGGLKVHPADVERRIASIVNRYFPASAFIITSMPDDKWVNSITLCIEGNPSILKRTEKEEKLLDELSNLLKKHEIPKRIAYQNTFPRTSSGKIRRNSIKDLFSSE